MQLLHPNFGRKTNEEVFFAHYPRLLEWAVRITHGDREEAEDLVHDLYIRVTRISRQIDELEAPESYLFRILRNLYYSQLRRAGRDPINELSIVDYDSVEHGLAAVDRRQLLFVQDHLRQICRFVCERKSTVRSASILILRFFLGYHPSELVKILQSPRSSVDRRLYVARSEARLSLKRPGAIRSISSGASAILSFFGEGEGTQKLFSELQGAIFSAVEGPCFERSALEQRYAADSEAPGLTALELSHLVSCRACLDEVNSILHLPLLKERSPEHGLDRDNNISGSGGTGAKGPQNRWKRGKGPSLDKIDRLAKEHFEHRPSKLQIAIDGEVRASQKIVAEVNELHLKLTRKEEPSFIEVFSEQGFCLAYLHVEDPVLSDQLEQVETILLSDDRSLTLTLTFAADVSIIHVLYCDPVLAESVREEIEEQALNSIALHRKPAVAPGKLPLEVVLLPEAWIRRWFGTILAWLRGCRESLPFFSTWRLPLAVALSVVVCGIWLQSRHAAPMTSSVLLQRAEAAEEAPARASEPSVVYEKVRIHTAARSIESRIYRDASGRRKPKAQPLDRQTVELQSKLATAGVDWNEPLSPATFDQWHNRAHAIQNSVHETGPNLLTLTATAANENVTQESLTVRANDFHPVSRTISFRDTGTVEIAELDYEVLPWSAVNGDLFEPLDSPEASRQRTPALPGLVLPFVPSSVKLDEAELSVRLVLNQLQADTGEQIEVLRQPDHIRVTGVVESDQRRQQLQFQLRQLPYVSASILTLAEMQARSPVKQENGGRVESATVQARETPLETYYLEHRADTAPLSHLSRQLFYKALTIDTESKAIDELQHRFAVSGVLSPIALATLTELMISHKERLLNALQEEKGLLAGTGIPVDSASRTAADAAAPEFLKSAAGKNLLLCKELALGEGDRRRPAEVIVSELSVTVGDLRAGTRQAQIMQAGLLGPEATK